MFILQGLRKNTWIWKNYNFWHIVIRPMFHLHNIARVSQSQWVVYQTSPPPGWPPSSPRCWRGWPRAWSWWGTRDSPPVLQRSVSWEPPAPLQPTDQTRHTHEQEHFLQTPEHQWWTVRSVSAWSYWRRSCWPGCRPDPWTWFLVSWWWTPHEWCPGHESQLDHWLGQYAPGTVSALWSLMASRWWISWSHHLLLDTGQSPGLEWSCPRMISQCPHSPGCWSRWAGWSQRRVWS